RGQTFIQALSVGNFEKTLIGGQPGVTTTWLVGVTAPWQGLYSGQAAIALASGILILINTYFFRILFGKQKGTITGLFLALDPFLLAHSRVVHTDALLALFYLASLASLLCGLLPIKIQNRYICISAVLAAGALLTKIFAIIIIPTIIATIVLFLWYKKTNWVQIVHTVGLWLAIGIMTTFIAWPALWSHSNKVFDLLSSRAALHSEGTRTEEISSTNWYYLRELLFRMSVPVAILLPFAFWQWRKSLRSTHAAITLYLVATGLLFAFVLNTGSDKSDRYILFTHLTLVVAAPLALTSMRKWTAVAIVIPIAYLAIDDARLHPYYLAHYNRLYPIEVKHKLGWGEGLEQAALWVETNHPGSKVLAYYPRVFSYFYAGEIETITHVNDATGDFAVLYRSMFERGPDAPETDIVNQFLHDATKKPAHIIKINGLPYAWIYPL
ncbi:MAG: glycosyltransferase family 39 protein, partial [Patescibacteria group bacterium]